MKKLSVLCVSLLILMISGVVFDASAAISGSYLTADDVMAETGLTHVIRTTNGPIFNFDSGKLQILTVRFLISEQQFSSSSFYRKYAQSPVTGIGDSAYQGSDSSLNFLAFHKNAQWVALMAKRNPGYNFLTVDQLKNLARLIAGRM